MPLKLHCTICDRFIENVTDTSSVTGKEICPDCGKRITQVRSDLEKFNKKWHHKLEVLYSNAKAELDELVSKIMKEKE